LSGRGTKKERTPQVAHKGGKKVTMANKEMTRAQALTIAIAAVENEEARAILEKMHAQITKPRVRKADDSKRLANLALGEEFAGAWNGDTFKAADVAATLGVSVAKACAICKVMAWDEVPTTEKVKVYTL